MKKRRTIAPPRSVEELDPLVHTFLLLYKSRDREQAKLDAAIERLCIHAIERTAEDVRALRDIAKAIEIGLQRHGSKLADGSRSVHLRSGMIKLRKVTELAVSSEDLLLAELKRLLRNRRTSHSLRGRISACIRKKEAVSRQTLKQEPEVLSHLRHAKCETSDSISIKPTGSTKAINVRIEDLAIRTPK